MRLGVGSGWMYVQIKKSPRICREFLPPILAMPRKDLGTQASAFLRKPTAQVPNFLLC